MESERRPREPQVNNNAEGIADNAASVLGVRRLVCPLANRRHELGKPCPVEGYTAIHRLKEHIYRKHSCPPTCARCYEEFTTEAEVEAHLQSEIACEQRPKDVRKDDIRCTKQQVQDIKSKRERGSSDEQEWTRIYRVLYPEVHVDHIPSPYVDLETTSDLSSLPEFKAILRAELYHTIRKTPGAKAIIEQALGSEGVSEAIERTRHKMKRLRTLSRCATNESGYEVRKDHQPAPEQGMVDGDSTYQEQDLNPFAPIVGASAQCRLPQRPPEPQVLAHPPPQYAGGHLATKSRDYVTPSDLHDNIPGSSLGSQMDDGWTEVDSSTWMLSQSSPPEFNDWMGPSTNQDLFGTNSAYPSLLNLKRRASRSPEYN